MLSWQTQILTLILPMRLKFMTLMICRYTPHFNLEAILKNWHLHLILMFQGLGFKESLIIDGLIVQILKIHSMNVIQIHLKCFLPAIMIKPLFIQLLGLFKDIWSQILFVLIIRHAWRISLSPQLPIAMDTKA